MKRFVSALFALCCALCIGCTLQPPFVVNQSETPTRIEALQLFSAEEDEQFFLGARLGGTGNAKSLFGKPIAYLPPVIDARMLNSIIGAESQTVVRYLHIQSVGRVSSTVTKQTLWDTFAISRTESGVTVQRTLTTPNGEEVAKTPSIAFSGYPLMRRSHEGVDDSWRVLQWSQSFGESGMEHAGWAYCSETVSGGQKPRWSARVEVEGFRGAHYDPLLPCSSGFALFNYAVFKEHDLSIAECVVRVDETQRIVLASPAANENVAAPTVRVEIAVPQATEDEKLTLLLNDTKVATFCWDKKAAKPKEPELAVQVVAGSVNQKAYKLNKSVMWVVDAQLAVGGTPVTHSVEVRLCDALGKITSVVRRQVTVTPPNVRCFGLIPEYGAPIAALPVATQSMTQAFIELKAARIFAQAKLYSGKLNRRECLNTMRSEVLTLKESENLILLLSGHGTMIRANASEPDNVSTYFVPSGTTQPLGQFDVDYITAADVVRQLTAEKSASLCLIVECCYSAGFLQAIAKELPDAVSFWGISAGGKDQIPQGKLMDVLAGIAKEVSDPKAAVWVYSRNSVSIDYNELFHCVYDRMVAGNNGMPMRFQSHSRPPVLWVK